ncbi:MBL fold metallo-hydrolase [Vibrio tapetis]|uniref:Right junction gene, LPS locus n=1 Tax=Vibrio tapetis subsp. tapetis TaxID=1671868 RepID=A0A2N8ZGJ6_9VIBR|nr:MBL fold metallo-hydrolase [Vibrio tapetis]SON51017.1 Right junction gene, LPS locus [Vibrio tapetis subsp. tapetis]
MKAIHHKTIHHGGKNTVTGSCHELQLGKNSLLIDCGLFQGQDLASRGNKALDIDFPIKHIKALLLTHSHIDHIGRIPWLLAAGFKAPIYCTPATAELAPLMLEDTLKLQLNLDKGQRARILERIRKQIKPIPYNQWYRINLKLNLNEALLKNRNISSSSLKNQSTQLSSSRNRGTRCPRSTQSKHDPQYDYCYIRFQEAGHILGSAYIEIKLPNNQVIVFSGDLGPSNTPLLPDPKPPKRADYLYLESTYGDKTHQDITTRRERLNHIINKSLNNGGTIIIPAFSVGRTQELLFDIEQLLHDQKLSHRLPIIVDSPLASKITRSYRRYRKLWSAEAKNKVSNSRQPLKFSQCIVIEDHKQHMGLVNRLATSGEPAIVISASGMCQGGRVVNYLKALLPDERTDVIFAGYQAHGTLGRTLQNSAKHAVNSVDINGERIPLKAQVHTMYGYSAHADQSDLTKFVAGIGSQVSEIHLIHGDVEPKKTLKQLLVKQNPSTKVIT